MCTLKFKNHSPLLSHFTKIKTETEDKQKREDLYY